MNAKEREATDIVDHAINQLYEDKKEVLIYLLGDDIKARSFFAVRCLDFSIVAFSVAIPPDKQPVEHLKNRIDLIYNRVSKDDLFIKLHGES